MVKSFGYMRGATPHSVLFIDASKIILKNDFIVRVD